MGLSSPQAAEIWRTYSSFADRPTRQAFLQTLRSVVDYRGQTVSALSRLRIRSEVPTLLIWGEKDQIIPVEHGHEAQAARLGSHLEVLPEVGHFPQIEAPTKVADVIGEFITASDTPARCASPDASPDIDTQGSPPAPSLAGKLKDLLDRRATVDRANGMLSSRAGLSAEDAFARLRDLSQTQNIGLDVAARRLTTGMVRESTRC